MPILHAIAQDLVRVLDPGELVDMYGLSPAEDLAEQLVAWWDHNGDSTPERLSAVLSEDFGRYCVRDVLRHLGLPFEKNASIETMIEQWFEHRQLEISKPFVRPHELAATIAELADQIGATPEKFDSVDVLLSRCSLLLRYVALYYAPELMPKECFHALMDEVSFDGRDPECAIEALSIDQLCRAVACDTRLKAEPYKKFGDDFIQLQAGPVERLRHAVAARAAGGSADQAKTFSDAAAALVDQWQGVIPKGAVMLEYRRADKLLEAVCFDEFNRRLTVSGIRVAMEDGDNVLLARAAAERVPAPNIKPVPRREAWVTPGRTSCGLAELVHDPPSSAPKQLFISYCHEDKKWADRVRVHLKPFQEGGKIRLWDDTRLQTGEWWNDEIESALQASKLAVLIVSPDFYASEYVRTKELPVLLRRARERRVRVFPLIVGAVLPESHGEVAALHAANDFERPLNGLTESEQERCLAALTRDIIRELS